MSSGAPTPAPIPVVEQPAMSYPARIANTFFAPSQAFAEIKKKSGWFVPWILIAIVSVLFVATVDYKIGFDKVAENQIKLNTKAMAQLEKLTPEQRERQLTLSTTITRYSSYASPVLALIWFMILAGILMATFNFGLGQSVRFPVSLGIVMWASVPGLIRSLLAILALFVGVDPDGFMIQNPVATNLSFLANPSTSKTLYVLLSSLDIFMFWTLILTAIGFVSVSKVKRGTAFGVVFGWYAVYMIGAVAISAMF